MALLEEISDRKLGLPLGIGLAVMAVSAGPALMRAARPVAKGAIKAYLALRARTREVMAEMSEQAQDLYAEAKHEMESSRAALAGEEAGKSRSGRARGADGKFVKPQEEPAGGEA
ncbi:MAG: DUF5132 domain-containing protein [Armatimonadetes bacterium]|nr:DUF5132 domain-containing protein [Armatimonadota bacterium]